MRRRRDPRAAREARVAQLREQFVGEGGGGVEESVAALTREVVPALVERLVRQQLERLPNPTAAIDELLPQLQEQILPEGRRRAEDSAAALARVGRPALFTRLPRQHLQPPPTPT